MGWWEDRAKQFDKVTRGSKADAKTAGGVGVARKMDNAAAAKRRSDEKRKAGYASGQANLQKERAAKPKGPSFASRVDKISRGPNATPKAATVAVVRSKSPSNATDANRTMDANKAKGDMQRAAARKSSTESRMKSRGNRIQAKDYKGKYWGPDEFKGNQAKIDAWKKAKKPRNSDGSPKV